jgi:hypothetical protein
VDALKSIGIVLGGIILFFVMFAVLISTVRLVLAQRNKDEEEKKEGEPKVKDDKKDKGKKEKGEPSFLGTLFSICLVYTLLILSIAWLYPTGWMWLKANKQFLLLGFFIVGMLAAASIKTKKPATFVAAGIVIAIILFGVALQNRLEKDGIITSASANTLPPQKWIIYAYRTAMSGNGMPNEGARLGEADLHISPDGLIVDFSYRGTMGTTGSCHWDKLENPYHGTWTEHRSNGHANGGECKLGRDVAEGYSGDLTSYYDDEGKVVSEDKYEAYTIRIVPRT